MRPQPPKTGSGRRLMPNRSSTPRLIRAANLSTSRAVAPPRLINASVCLVEIPTLPSVSPRRKPARSMSHAAGSLTRPASAGNAGGCVPASAVTRSRSPGATSGFMKNDPTLRVSGSPTSITMPFRRRTASTAFRTSSTSGVDTPACAKYCVMSGYTVVGRPARSRKVTVQITKRPRSARLNRLMR